MTAAADCSSSDWPPTAAEWFGELIAVGVPCGPINTIDQGVAFATEIGLDPVSDRGLRRQAIPTIRHPITFSATAAALRPAAARARRARRRDQGLADRAGATRAAVTRRSRGAGAGHDAPGQAGRAFPTSLGTSTADTITLLGHDLAADLMGKVGFGELALWLVTQQRPTPSQVRVFEAVLVALADHGFTPYRDRRQADLSQRARLGARRDRGRAARRRLAIPRRDRGCRRVPGRDARAGGRARCQRTSRASMRSRRAARSRPRAPRGTLRARARPPGPQGHRPAHARLAGDRRGRGAARPAPAAVRGDRPGAPAGARPHAAAQRRGHLRRRPRRPWPARPSCCAGSRCSPAPPACSATWPRSSGARSAWTST